jgi:nicotinamidase-related amidase
MTNKPKLIGLFIDCQKDFVEINGNLTVAGGKEDMQNIADFIEKNSRLLDDLILSMDSHQAVHIAHPIFWRDKKGNHPAPFTPITSESVRSGEFSASNPSFQKWAEQYVEALDTNGKYSLTIWNPHCIVGTDGWSFEDSVCQEIYNWEKSNFARATIIPKGNNHLTEHYSAFKADVELPGDPSTQANHVIIDALSDLNGDKDQIIIGGEAFNFCVYNTLRDIMEYFGDEYAKKFVIFEDCTSSILVTPETQKLHDDAKQHLLDNGARFTTSKDWSL